MASEAKTWTFREDEGGTTVITYWAEAGIVSERTGPDCDGTVTDVTWEFHPADEIPAGHAEGLHYRDNTIRSCRIYDVWERHPLTAAADHVRDHLGWALLAGKYPLSAPQS